MATTSGYSKDLDGVDGSRITTQGILKVLTTGLNNGTVPDNTTGSVLPSSGNNTQSLVTTLQSIVDFTTEALTTENIPDPLLATTSSTVSPVVTSHGTNDVMGGLDDMYTYVAVTEAPGIVLTPMMKWFIATGTVIVLVFILIIVNCFLSYKDQLTKTMKDMKYYAAEEKRVRREQNMVDMQDKASRRQTHVFWTWMGNGKKSPTQPRRQYSRC